MFINAHHEKSVIWVHRNVFCCKNSTEPQRFLVQTIMKWDGFSRTTSWEDIWSHHTCHMWVQLKQYIACEKSPWHHDHDDDVYILTRTCVKCTALLTTHGAKKYAEMFLFSFVCAKYKSYCLYGKHRKWLISENYHHKKW